MHLQTNASDGLLEQRERGFTLVELMIVVAIIGILASLAVYMFSGQRKKATAKAEVSAIFAEFKIKQEQHRLEEGSYLSSSATNSEGDMWPAAPSTDGSKTTLLPYPANWVALRMAPETSNVRCSYVMVVGVDGTSPVGTVASTNFGYIAPAENWYYVLAECDMDQDPAVNSFYFQHSGDSELFYVNQGK